MIAKMPLKLNPLITVAVVGVMNRAVAFSFASILNSRSQPIFFSKRSTLIKPSVEIVNGTISANFKGNLTPNSL